jgi:enterochelin esterase family protein
MTHPLLSRAWSSGAPIIEGTHAIFLWQGAWPPVLAGDFNRWDARRAPAWQQLAPELWACDLEFPSDAYIEYAFFADMESGTRLPDPLNPRGPADGLHSANDFFHMPDSRPTPLAPAEPAALEGALMHRELQSSWLLANGRRSVWLYRPPVAGPAPLVVVFDGGDYLERARLPGIVDNLIVQDRIRPVALALVDHGGAARGIEYGCSEATVRLVTDLVLPLAQAEMSLIDPARAPGAFGVLGASAGGSMALFTALSRPDLFGQALSQSGAFHNGSHESVLFRLIRCCPPQPVRVWMDCGCYERLAEVNRRMYDLLCERGYEATYREYSGGHNYPAWRNDVWRGLETLYGPPSAHR